MDPVKDGIIHRIAEALQKDGIDCSVLLTEKDWGHAAIHFSVKQEDDGSLNFSQQHRGLDYVLNLDSI